MNVGPCQPDGADDAGGEIRARRREIVVMMHDTIPLDYPAVLPRQVRQRRLRQRLAVVADHADLVVHTRAVHAAQTEGTFRKTGPGAAGHRGTAWGWQIADAGRAALGPGQTAPYFVALGTIEPRKNHGFWSRSGRALANGAGPVPHLLHRRQSRLGEADAVCATGRHLPRTAHASFCTDLGDGAVPALLQDARGAAVPEPCRRIRPTPARGRSLGMPVICGELAVW